MTYFMAYWKATHIVDDAVALLDRYETHNKMLKSKLDGALKKNEELQAQLNAAKEMNTENLRLLDSYMQNNSRQAQDIIELEAVAIALYDVLWHQVYSVEDEIKDKDVVNLNAYKTIVALFEAEGED